MSVVFAYYTCKAVISPSSDHMGNIGQGQMLHDVLFQCGPHGKVSWSPEFILLITGPSLQNLFNSLVCFVMSMARYHERVRGNSVPLLKLLVCSHISTASFTK
jgi:hypothetical protein